jgi:hypothetical protein
VSGFGNWSPTGGMKAASAPTLRPSRWWYWVAGAALAGAVVWLGLGVFFGLRSFGSEFQRVPIPGQGEVSLDKPGGYTLYFEGLNGAEIPPFRVLLSSVDGGEEVPIRADDGASTYNWQAGGRAGRPIGTFHVDVPGRYLLQTTGESQAIPATVAVGPGIGEGLFRPLALTVTAALTLFLGGVALMVVVAVRRHRARRLQPGSTTQPGTRRYGATPAGWFADPGGCHELRYWDGQEWTEHVSDNRIQTADPLSGAVPPVPSA